MKLMWSLLIHLSAWGPLCQGSSWSLDTPKDQSKQRAEGRVKNDWDKWSLAQMDGKRREENSEHWDKNGTWNNVIKLRWSDVYWITPVGSITLMCKYGRWQILVPHLLDYVSDPETPQSHQVSNRKHYSHLCQHSPLFLSGWRDRNILQVVLIQ